MSDKEKELKYHGDTIFLKKDRRVLKHINMGAVFLAHQQGYVEGKPCKLACEGDKVLTEEEHRAIYKPMNKGIRRNGREA